MHCSIRMARTEKSVKLRGESGRWWSAALTRKKLLMGFWSCGDLIEAP